MNIQIQFYGGLRRRVGSDTTTIHVDAEAPTVGDAVEAVQREIPALKGILTSVARAVGDEIVNDEHILEEGDTLALLPPVSGGSPGRYLSEEPLDQDRLIEETADERCGALVVFSGDVRNHNKGRDDVVAIDYEAHGPIATKVLKTIEEEALEQFDIHQCRIQHRVGRVEVGQSSVLVVCRGAHRGATFEAARYAIDELKRRTPLWKRECYADGTDRYLDGTPLEK